MNSQSPGYQYIAGRWRPGKGPSLVSVDAASGEEVWEGGSASQADVDAAVDAARKAAPSWSKLSFDQRCSYIEAFAEKVKKEKKSFAEVISKESGKPLWESSQEVGAMIAKASISVKAYQDRCREVSNNQGAVLSTTRHKPHGVLAVFGPFNFPGHLPNGHIIPALLAGNTLVFKPSELTPWVAEVMTAFWDSVNLPAGVLNMVQGGRDTGKALAEHKQIDGLLFTGSAATGLTLSQQFGKHPEKMLALEMGGNNPLVVQEVGDILAAAYLTVVSSFLTSGQRCTCARRLLLPEGEWGHRFLDTFAALTRQLSIGRYDAQPTPFMGPLISPASASAIVEAQAKLIHRGADVVVEAAYLDKGAGFLSPGILDVTRLDSPPDEEFFGPLIQVTRYSGLEEALQLANSTRFGLSAGLISEDPEEFERFYHQIRAGIVNWNTPLTGASSAMPFGGVGLSGNHRPSAYYAADYCAYPVVSAEIEQPRASIGVGLKDIDVSAMGD